MQADTLKKVQALNIVPLIASIIKRAPTVKESITLEFTKELKMLCQLQNDNHVIYYLVIINIEDIKCLN